MNISFLSWILANAKLIKYLIGEKFVGQKWLNISNILSLLTNEINGRQKIFSQWIFLADEFYLKRRFSPIRAWEKYTDNNDKKTIFIFIFRLYSYFHLQQSTKTKAITKVVVCVRQKGFLLLRRHHYDRLSYHYSIKLILESFCFSRWL